MHKSYNRVRARVLFLTIATLTPVFILIAGINLNQLKISKDLEIEKLDNIAKSIASENTQIIEGARQLLVTLSATPEVKSGKSICNNYLSNLLTKYQRYGNFGVSNLKGDVICSAVTPITNINLSDRLFFQETLKTNNFSVGEYVVSRTINESSINFGYPMENSHGVVYATLSLEWLSDFLASIEIDENIVVLVLDGKGVILARNPDLNCDCIGKEFSGDPLVKSLTKDFGTVQSSGIDGVERIYSYKKIGANNPGIYLAVGKSKNDIYKSSQQYFNKVIAFSVLIVLASIGVGFYVGRWLISRSIEELESIEKLRHDFVSLVSHQLRTPITSIKWFTQILLSGSSGKLNRKQRDLLMDTLASTQRMTGLVSILLQIAKLESGKIKPDKTSVTTTTLINSVVDEVKTGFRAKKLTIKLNIAKATPKKIFVDEKLFRQLLVNLINNAFKYSNEKGSVYVTTTKLRNNLQISVTDFGIGIPESEKNILFQKFSRASNAKIVDGEGAGLGLYLSKLIVEAHIGKIYFESTKGKTTFYVTIPI